VADGETGFLVAPETAAVADRLGRLLDDTPLRQRLAARGYERVRDELSLERMVAAAADVVRACAVRR
jgi:glycosyltransferase involved in cell wall biosynthesis